MQMICALLIFQRPELPAPLWRLSPWLDHMIVPLDVVYDQLAEQPHRRFIKTHTPLDGIPLHPQVTYIVTARHPLDMFVSLRHHLDNIDHSRLGQLTGQATPPEPGESLHDSLLRWIEDDDDPRGFPESLPGVLWHLSDAWARRGEPNVLLVHYDDLSADLEGQMRGIAGRLGIAVPERAWPALTQAATFERMRDQRGQARSGRPGDLQGHCLVLPPGHLGRRARDPQRRGDGGLLRACRPAGSARHARVAALAVQPAG